MVSCRFSLQLIQWQYDHSPYSRCIDRRRIFGPGYRFIWNSWLSMSILYVFAFALLFWVTVEETCPQTPMKSHIFCTRKMAPVRCQMLASWQFGSLPTGVSLGPTVAPVQSMRFCWPLQRGYVNQIHCGIASLLCRGQFLCQMTKSLSDHVRRVQFLAFFWCFCFENYLKLSQTDHQRTLLRRVPYIRSASFCWVYDWIRALPVLNQTQGIHCKAGCDPGWWIWREIWGLQAGGLVW